MKKIALIAAFCAASAVCAEDPEGVLTLTSPGTLSAAMEAAGASLAEISSYTQLVVDCGGTITSDTSISDWTGDLRIKTNSVFKVTAVGAQGAAAGTIYIENGGQYRVAYATAEGFVQVNKTCYFEGEGPDGLGALYSESASQQNGHCVWPYYLHLTGPAKWTGKNGNQDINGALLDLHGHTLTFRVDGRFHNVTVTNGGHIVTIGHAMLMQGTTKFCGGDTNTLTFTGGMARFWGTGSMSTPWKLIFDNVSGNDIYPGNSVCDWQGPVVMNGPVRMQRWNEWSHLRFTNVVSGAGGLIPNGNVSRNNHMTLTLSNPNNSFTGGVEMKESVLILSANGALPAAGAAMKMTDGTVRLPSSETYDLPAAIFSGTGMVVNGTGTWRGKVTKTGSGEMLYVSSIGSPLLDVQGGTFTLAMDLSRGVWLGSLVGANSGFEDAWGAGLILSNSVSAYPDLVYKNVYTGGWTDYMYLSYSGYLWNHSEEPQTWTFACCFDDRAKLYINGSKVFETSAWQSPFFGQATLNPGPNRFEFMGLNWTGGGGGSSGRDNSGNATWELAKALSYHIGATDSRSAADYTAFTAVDGLLTPTDGSLASLVDAAPRFPGMKLAAGVTFGAGGLCYPVDELEGLSAMVVNGGLNIGEKWTLPAADVMTNGMLSVAGELCFTEGAKVDVTNLATLVKVDMAHAYTIARAASVTGTPKPSPALEAAKWHVTKVGVDVKLFCASGCTLILR